MAHAASQKWENGVLVERAIETNRHRILPDGTEIGEKEEITPTAAKPYKTPTPTKSAANRKAIQSSENKAVASAEKKSQK